MDRPSSSPTDSGHRSGVLHHAARLHRDLTTAHYRFIFLDSRSIPFGFRWEEGSEKSHHSFFWCHSCPSQFQVGSFFSSKYRKMIKKPRKVTKKKHFVVAVCYSRCLHMVSFGCFFFPCFFFSSSVGKSCRHWRCLLNVFQRVE